jgi:hypothetical protein
MKMDVVITHGGLVLHHPAQYEIGSRLGGNLSFRISGLEKTHGLTVLGIPQNLTDIPES